MKPETMSVDECIGFVFDWPWLPPFTKENPSSGWVRRDGKDPRLTRGHIPEMPSPTIDAAAAAMPEGWQIQNIGFHIHGVAEKSVQAFATKGDWRLTMREGKEVPGTRAMGQADTELLARWRLVVACMMAEKEVGDE